MRVGVWMVRGDESHWLVQVCWGRGSVRGLEREEKVGVEEWIVRGSGSHWLVQVR